MNPTRTTQAEIDPLSEEWFVFCGQFAQSEGFAPNPRDSRVKECWRWWQKGVDWGTIKQRQTAKRDYWRMKKAEQRERISCQKQDDTNQTRHNHEKNSKCTQDRSEKRAARLL